MIYVTKSVNVVCRTICPRNSQSFMHLMTNEHASMTLHVPVFGYRDGPASRSDLSYSILVNAFQASCRTLTVRTADIFDTTCRRFDSQQPQQTRPNTALWPILPTQSSPIVGKNESKVRVLSRLEAPSLAHGWTTTWQQPSKTEGVAVSWAVY